MGSQVVTFAASICPQIKTNSLKMVVKSGGNWKRPVNRMYAYNFQIGENYYLPMTSYLEAKAPTGSDVPGPLCFSERIALHPLNGTSIGTSSVMTSSVQTTSSSQVTSSYTVTSYTSRHQ